VYLLGINGGVLAGNQDPAAALIKDGKIVAAAEEERFNRIKHSNGQLPRRAIRYCLKEAGIGIQDVAAVSFPGETYENFQEILANYFDFHFGFAPPIRLVNHHLAHAASAYYLWGRDPALVLTMDYSGDRISTFAALGEGLSLKEILRIGKPNSLGIFYSMLTQYLGFEKDEDEYKVMGLSSYGCRGTYDLSHLLRIKGKTYELSTRYLAESVAPHRPAPSKQERIFADNLGLPQKARLASEPITQYYKDIAACGQAKLEEVVLHVVKCLVEETGVRRLCLAGGVALNCVMNQRLREAGLVDEIFVPPHVSDAGMSIGGAVLMSIERGIPVAPLEHCFLGPSFTEAEIESVLKGCCVPYVRPENIERYVAGEIARGKIVGWFQGRMEFGPRALGARSILADCRDPEMTSKINSRVKFREEFRPFAPSVLWEKAGEYFEGIVASPYMTMTFSVRPEKRTVIPAVTHVDGTARVQTVHKDTNPKYYNLIQEFEKLTGVPVILNTSMNVMGQPICCTPRSAVETFYGTGMDGLAIGPFYLSKETPCENRSAH
jgi:carbamoyltransferase